MSGNTVRETIIVKDKNGQHKVLFVTHEGENFVAAHIVGTVQLITDSEAIDLKHSNDSRDK